MELPELGVGVVYVPGLEPLLEPGSTCVDVIEIEPQTLWHYNNKNSTPYYFPAHTLQHLRSFKQPKIIHSVGFAVGGSKKPSSRFTRALSKTIVDLEAAWASEHLSFTQADSNHKSFHTGFMLPPLQTEEGALIAADTIRSTKSQLPVPFAVETTVNYLKPRKGDLTDGEFVALAVNEADCGILLDLHNIWTNERNGRQKVSEFLKCIPLERVWEIHLGGGFEYQGYWLDAHSGSVPDPVMQITKELIPSLPNLKAIIYEIFPSFITLFGLGSIQKQLEDIQEIWTRTNTRAKKQAITVGPRLVDERDDKQDDGVESLTPKLWEKNLAELVTFGKPKGLLAEELKQDASVQMVTQLICKFRAGSIVKVLDTLTSLILASEGGDYLENILADYFKQTKPKAFASEEALGFIEFLKKQEMDIPYLKEIIAYEKAVIRALMREQTQYLHFDFDPRQLLLALQEGNLPETLDSGNYELEIPPEVQGSKRP